MSIDAKQLVSDIQNIKQRIIGIDSTYAFMRTFFEDYSIRRMEDIKQAHDEIMKTMAKCSDMLEQYKDATKMLKSFKSFKRELAEFKKSVMNKTKVKVKDKKEIYEEHKKDIKIKKTKKPKKAEIAQTNTES